MSEKVPTAVAMRLAGLTMSAPKCLRRSGLVVMSDGRCFPNPARKVGPRARSSSHPVEPKALARTSNIEVPPKRSSTEPVVFDFTMSACDGGSFSV